LKDGVERMNEYPKKTCEIDRLVRNPKSVEQALAGIKTQQRRDGVYGYPGENFELKGAKFIITDLVRQPLGDMREEDAISEGYENLEAYKAVILSMHHGMTWDESHLVWVHHFKKI
jgi:N4-acetylcytidine amidohydrolase